MSASDHNCNKCCPGPMGPIGLMGPQGPAGVPGNQGVPGNPGRPGHRGEKGDKGDKGDAGEPGHDGQDGQPGIQGVPGEAGPRGEQGIPGPKGDCVECPCHCNDPEFAAVYSTMFQSLSASPGALLPGGIVILENSSHATANIDISQAALNGKIIVNKAGWYDVSAAFCGALNPVQSPLPVWSFSLFKNGAYVSGSTFADMTLSPDQRANEIVDFSLVHLAVGDVLEWANTSTAVVELTSPTLGTNAQTNSAYLKIILLKAD